ncbi:bifunctional glycosyltransferase/CDP-glycerol:glycerophosphate glycerophosphotransferase [Actinomadura rupiterrae]|uniref:bifunctional glycosyltransferase/CDP-glycerol:glycerophosphate glycerophosphotransferase n=1 Tax=Actinomadura rupiterrae TaxID=559627 RepID=UPI0020A456C9|nr:bifunctional glycosyltransferase/CDP-glycerol:glycerophosphate glycerophosphotransferase [Actinomadura rupiterrae]MCP2335549.1 CDP-glycerol glycerophosphotransferase [Actinomadura rupiterrae]
MSPKLSVVVPFRNAEERLGACLVSLADQRLRDLEVVMVDDGSTDAGGVVAKEAAVRDVRFRLVEQPPRGLDAARDAGVAAASGELLAFADAEEAVPAGFYADLVAALDRRGTVGSGSDLVAPGPVPADRTTLARNPLLLHDLSLSGKVFRRAFWDGCDLASAKGERSLAVRALALAEAIDVVNTPSPRDTSTRDTSPREGGVAERVAAAGADRDFLTCEAPEAVRAFDEHVLARVELAGLMSRLVRADEAERAELTALGAEVAGRLDPSVPARLPALARLKLHLLARGLTAELVEVVRYEEAGDAANVRVVRRGRRGRWFAAHPYFEDASLAVPAHVYDVTDEMRPVARVDRAVWAGDRLRIEGHAYIPMLDAEGGRIRLWLLASRRLGLVRVPVKRVRRPDVTAASGQSAVSYDASGFTAEIDPDALKLLGRWRTGDWRLCVDIATRGVHRRRTLAPPRTGERWPLDRELSPSVRLQTVAVDGRQLLRVRANDAVLTGHARSGRNLEIRGVLARDPGAKAWLTATARGVAKVRGKVERLGAAEGGGVAFRALLPLADLTAVRADWTFGITGGLKLAFPAEVPEARYALRGTEFALTVTHAGNLCGITRAAHLVLTEALWHADGTLHLAGTCADPDTRTDALTVRRPESGERYEVPLTWQGPLFVGTLAPRRMRWLGLDRPLVPGRWELLADDRPLLAERRAAAGLPGPRTTGRHEVTVRASRNGSVTLRVRTALADDERGPYRQALIQRREYPAKRAEPVLDLALFDSYRGRQYSCNPRGLYDELRRRGSGLDCVWVTRNGDFGTPAGARTVLAGSREHYEAVARARYLFGNWSQAEWFAKRRGQTYVQCWHGTPLKRLGWDVMDMPHRRGGKRVWMEHDVPQWDVLLAQNEYSVPHFRRAFDYAGEVLVTGYPRNDILASAHRGQMADVVRFRLGVPAGKRVVLYAPTWRDDVQTGRGRLAYRPALDLARLSAALGPDHVLLLRTHYLVADRAPVPADGTVLDVSAYPDIAELYLIADALVTDYSSAMFDFAVTGAPILLYAYDLERYRERVRGFYFDLEAEAPGPLLRTQDDLTDALRALDDVPAAYAERYAGFRDRYCPHDDGHAAARVLDAVL